jgi:hypothetical protein
MVWRKRNPLADRLQQLAEVCRAATETAPTEHVRGVGIDAASASPSS